LDKKSTGIQVGLFAVIVGLWQLLPTTGLVSRFAIASLSSSLESIPSLFSPNNFLIPGGMVPQIEITLSEVGIAFGLAVVIGISIGFLLGYFDLVQSIYEPLLYIVYAIPGIILYPIIFLFFTVGEPSKIVFGLLLGIFPMATNSISGFREAKRRYHRLGYAMGANAGQSFSKLMLPGAAPYLMSGLRLSLAHVMLAVIGAEIIASKGGLGWSIRTFSDNFDPAQMFGTIIIVIGITVAFLVSVSLIERKVFSHAV
jgi:ABC-type nitrate/sulfonate/bicarbonate transport system permease component